MSLPWYVREPLHFGCTRCGACCRRPGLVEVLAREAAAIAEAVLGSGTSPHALNGTHWTPLENGTFRIEVTEEAPCPFLGRDGCTVQAVKPIQCASYPFWPELLESAEAWDEESIVCEGIGRGPRYRLVEVARILAGRAGTRDDDGPSDGGPSDDGSVGRSRG